jgi:hypothetical protein
MSYQTIPPDKSDKQSIEIFPTSYKTGVVILSEDTKPRRFSANGMLPLTAMCQR